MNMIIGNGPLDKLEIRNLSTVADLEIYKRKFELMFESSRTMRHNFMEKYHHPFVSIRIILGWKHCKLLNLIIREVVLMAE